MTLLDARQYDPARERRKRNRIILGIVLLLVVAALGWWFRYWPEERIADHFFEALQKQDYQTAYGVWMHDPQWKQHQERFQKYPYNEFYRDWGPGGEWGLVKSHKVYAAGTPPGGGSGVVVDVTVNDRAQRARVWVEKSDKTMSFSPY
ncbi:MAG TPA: hypothetical protein VI386_07480 [Candidatus Sulfotelmatobacter sp.]